MVMPFDPTATVPLALITVSSPVFDETKLYDVAYFDLRNRLQGISGVIAPAVYGGKLRRVLAYVDRDKLQARGLSPMDVVQTLRSFSTLIPTGDAKLGDLDYQIITNGLPSSVAEMNDFPIKIDDRGAPVFIRDIGQVEDTHQIQTNVVRITAPPDMRAKRQVYIPIYRHPGANTVAVVNAIRDALPEILKRLPSGINLNVVMDQSFYVRQAIRNLVDEGVIGGLLAALMILIFIAEWRSTLMMAFTIPLSILAALIGLYFAGHSINAMTLGGLALAVGRLIDDAVVVLENTDRYLALGKTPADAALEGAAEVTMPVLVATITTIVIFFPVVFLTGIGKFLFMPLAVSVAFSIAASYFAAMLAVPLFSARFLKTRDPAALAPGSNWTARFASDFERRFEKVRERYTRWLEWALAHVQAVIAIAVAALASALLLSSFVGRELFPTVDAGQLTIQLHARSGTRIERTEALIGEIERSIKQTIPNDDLLMLISNVGVLLDWPAAYTPNAGPQDAFILVQLTEHRSRSAQAYAAILRKMLNEKFPDVDFSFNLGGIVTAALNGGLPSPIDIQIIGNSLKTSMDIAARVQHLAAEVPGAADVRTKQRFDYPAIEIDVDRTKAAFLGLTPIDVVKNVVTSLNSSVNFDPAFWIDPKNGNHYFMGAQYPENTILSTTTLEDIPITNALGLGLAPFPSRGAPPDSRSDHDQQRLSLLQNLASLQHTTAPTEVDHLNINRVIDVYVNLSGRDAGSVAADIDRKLDTIRPKLPAGYSVAVRGEIQSMRESFASLSFALLLAVILVYLVMVAQFRSFLDPLIVMASAPDAIVGVVAALLLTRTSFNIQAFLGLIFVVGIAVSNKVLIVDFANRLIEQGRSIEEAAIEAARIRLRPILMTSLATVTALLPMAIGFGHGSEANVPLARAVVGGHTVSTIVSLIVVPTVYVALKKTAAARRSA
jgi:multidrug efflux pump subunit AcrB